jgi:hypothetical protein
MRGLEISPRHGGSYLGPPVILTELAEYELPPSVIAGASEIGKVAKPPDRAQFDLKETRSGDHV